MRNQYEYELGLLTGMNEAIMNQNDQMRDRILQQNAQIQEVCLSMGKLFKSLLTVASSLFCIERQAHLLESAEQIFILPVKLPVKQILEFFY